jgi:hypothetical protein
MGSYEDPIYLTKFSVRQSYCTDHIADECVFSKDSPGHVVEVTNTLTLLELAVDRTANGHVLSRG